MNLAIGNRFFKGVGPDELAKAIKELAADGVRFAGDPDPMEVAQAIALLTGRKVSNVKGGITDTILLYINPPTPKEPVKLQPLKQSRAMEIAQSRIRADFAPVSVSGTKR